MALAESEEEIAPTKDLSTLSSGDHSKGDNGQDDVSISRLSQLQEALVTNIAYTVILTVNRFTAWFGCVTEQ